MPASEIPVLAYASALPRWDVRIVEDEYHCAVIVPPIPSWHLLPRGYLIGSIVLSVLLLIMTGVAIADFNESGNMIVPISMYGAALALVLALAWLRLHQYIILTVTSDSFYITRRSGIGQPSIDMWPRNLVHEIKSSTINRRLLIRIHGRDMLEIPVCPDPAVTQQVAEVLSAALARRFETISLPPGQTPAPVMLKSRPQKPGFWRNAISIALSIVLVGVFVMALFAPILWVLIVPLAIACGLVFGTQPKEYYL